MKTGGLASLGQKLAAVGSDASDCFQTGVKVAPTQANVYVLEVLNARIVLSCM